MPNTSYSTITDLANELHTEVGQLEAERDNLLKRVAELEDALEDALKSKQEETA